MAASLGTIGVGWPAFKIERELACHVNVSRVNAKERHVAWVLGVLGSGSFVAITQLAVKADPQPIDVQAICWFAAALPLLAGSALIIRERRRPKNPVAKVLVRAAFVFGPSFVSVGIGQMLWAVSFSAAIIFGVIGAIMIALSILIKTDTP